MPKDTSQAEAMLNREIKPVALAIIQLIFLSEGRGGWSRVISHLVISKKGSTFTPF